MVAIVNDAMSPGSSDRKFGVHPDVLKLGLVSFLTDLSSEMIFSVFAIFFTTIAGEEAKGQLVDYTLALRDAKRAIRRTIGWSDPYFWAPFVLAGAR